MDCERFHEFVKEQFAFLFNEFGFSLIHLDEQEYRSDHCLIGLESSTCRIQIYRTWEEANVWISQPDTPFSWTLRTSKHGAQWYPVEAIIDFVLQRKRRNLEWWWQMSIEEVLSTLACELQPIMFEALAICTDRKSFSEFEKFCWDDWMK